LYSPRWLFLYPGVAAVIVGLIGMGLLTIGPVRVGRIGFDIHTLLLASLLVMVGTQSMFFAILAQEFAINDGLVPPEQRFKSFFARLPIEVTLVMGLILVGAGGVGILVAVLIWGSVDFGGLRVSEMMRMLVPSVTAIAVGFQLMIASFFKGILTLKVVK
jgi:hypothetical protein